MPDFSNLSVFAIAGIIVFSVMEAIKCVIHYARVTYLRRANGGDPVDKFLHLIEKLEKKVNNIDKRLKKIEGKLS